MDAEVFGKDVVTFLSGDVFDGGKLNSDVEADEFITIGRSEEISGREDGHFVGARKDLKQSSVSMCFVTEVDCVFPVSATFLLLLLRSLNLWEHAL